jgi:predicted regulator of Ras-like GTPase activity (Roadblock/LC7/MglB family)
MIGRMNLSNISLHELEFGRLKSILAKTQRDLRADLVLLIDRSGHQIAAEGPAENLDLTALSSLAAANLAATDGLAHLIGEPDFSILYHQGKSRNIHISDVLKRFSLVLVFDETVSLGMVRWKVKRATASLEDLEAEAKSEAANSSAPAAPRFTDEEIDRLFGKLTPKIPVERKV